MARTSIRVAAKKRLIGLLEAHPDLADVDVYYAWSGEPARDHIRVGAPPTSGDSSVPTMKSGRKDRDDRFGISVYVLASTPGREQPEAEERAEQLLAIVESVVADHSLLQLNDQQLDGVVMATVGDLDGPDSEPQTEGALAWGRLVVNVHARLI